MLIIAFQGSCHVRCRRKNALLTKNGELPYLECRTSEWNVLENRVSEYPFIRNFGDYVKRARCRVIGLWSSMKMNQKRNTRK